MKRSLITRIAWWLYAPIAVYLTLNLMVAVLFSNLDRVYAVVTCVAFVWGCFSHLRWLRQAAWAPVDAADAADAADDASPEKPHAAVNADNLYHGLINRDVSERTVWL